ncbi:MAG TPA: hypothetical protein PLV25_03930, partial [Opitutales bacterium]|nr:hypothetical protein [Opitutales bacterium]
QVVTLCANIFDYFTQERERLFDLIVLDPPPFAKSKQALAGALRGYKELNLRAMKRLRPGGILATYACSHAIDEALFTQVVAQAASDAKRSTRVIDVAQQPQDHPRILEMPESTYLKGLI